MRSPTNWVPLFFYRNLALKTAEKLHACNTARGIWMFTALISRLLWVYYTSRGKITGNSRIILPRSSNVYLLMRLQAQGKSGKTINRHT
ncbi:hypothetical protein I7I53_03460 [Histoplasma capsulatum var. duboisii H88]|uniref:Uncharacterized protein n=1 Tax=Ajellomyces capsulatus (strain H88) TaxID=544711 RepID=A0A8A1LNM3_AJEC8|nr:hypothetical protein I7I53_03460 [Histoplasma capsulatum var. duboisii H88]